jgi:hypothetical protein
MRGMSKAIINRFAHQALMHRHCTACFSHFVPGTILSLGRLNMQRNNHPQPARNKSKSRFCFTAALQCPRPRAPREARNCQHASRTRFRGRGGGGGGGGGLRLDPLHVQHRHLQRSHVTH